MLEKRNGAQGKNSKRTVLRFGDFDIKLEKKPEWRVLKGYYSVDLATIEYRHRHFFMRRRWGWRELETVAVFCNLGKRYNVFQD